MQLPEPQSKTYTTLISDIEAGRIKIPQFQREFVWSKEKSAHLLDSIIKGYPIGTFIIWKTRENLRSVRNIGNAQLPEPPNGDYVHYVLDGQQRLTSLFASLKGLTVLREGKNVDFSEIYIDLVADEHQRIVITDITDKEEGHFIKLNDLINLGFAELARYPAHLHPKMQKYKEIIAGYNFSLVSIADAPIDVATEIFTRINEGGKPLTVFEIMVAKTFDASRDFDLSEKYDELLGRLKEVNYETISSTTILQLISVLLTKTKECTKKHILSLNRGAFIDDWDRAVDALESTIDYFRSYFRIPVSQLLPYNALLIPYAYFFYHHPDKPTGDMQRRLTDFFWRISLSGRYSFSLESKIARDIKRIEEILQGNQPEYDFPVDLSPEFIKQNGVFRASASHIKALLCLFAYFEPKSFNDNSKVNIDNGWLKQANSKNYHHFFPKAYLRKQEGRKDDEINHIANITIVDDYLNKREIGSKSPSDYMQKFSSNPHLRETMKTHLIDSDSPSIEENDYDRFIEERCAWIARELQARVISQDIDKNKVVLPQEEEPEESEIAA